MLRFLLAGFLTLTYGCIAFADCNSVACWDETIDLVYPHSNGTVYVKFSGDQPPLDCTLHSGRFFVFDGSDAHADYFYSALLRAHAKGEPVHRIKADPGTEICTLTYVQLGLPQG